MSNTGDSGSPERDQTNASLQSERTNADQALASRLAAVESQADSLVRVARENADVVLSEARALADQQLGDAATPSAPLGVLAEQRALEDEAVQNERDTADVILQRERAETAAALARLLPLEREQTDRYLLIERARADDIVLHRDDFLGMITHDLRNLLSGVVMSTGMLTRDGADLASQVPAAVVRIRRYVARMNRLIGDLLDVTSINAGQLAMTPALSDAAAAVDDAVSAFQTLAVEKGLTLAADETTRPLPARFDYERIQQVLANLITNAIKFTPAGGTIRVYGEAAEDEVRISVADSGIGIASASLETIFLRFWQVNPNDRRGSGLGLYISKNIVEAHGGRIAVTSTPGQGSVFTFTLPL